MVNHARLNAQLREWIYANQTLTDLARPSLITVFVVLIAGLLMAIPKDVQWSRSRRRGRRLKGPELVSLRQFNRRTRADGTAFVQTRSLPAKLIGVQPAVAIPRAVESSHLLIMGDSGTGKSALPDSSLVSLRTAATPPSCTTRRSIHSAVLHTRRR